MSTPDNWKDWLKAWEEQLKQSEVLIEQAGIVIPAIKKKIEELEALENKNGE